MENKSIEESIVSAMDMTDISLIKHLPYILQDFWEIGSSSEEIIKIIKKYKTDYSNLNILDLGSGKGAVSIKIAAELKCVCFGIDAINDFVVFSNNKAKEYSVNNICTFETNDIRARIKTLEKYDIILSVAIGPVFGNYYKTLIELDTHLNNDGLIIIDDAFNEDDCNNDFQNILRKKEIIQQINNAGMDLIEIITVNEIIGINEEYENQFQNIQKRCNELIEKYPENKKAFLRFIEEQKEEYEILSNEIIPAIFVIKKRQS
ncbi:MAG: class I SAM-dependent methyltransferase [Treponema sp.]|nr:class I SAM-dependent methyltransferase [Treponema sp.]